MSLPALTDILEEYSCVQEMIVTLEFSFNGVALIFNLPEGTTQKIAIHWWRNDP